MDFFTPDWTKHWLDTRWVRAWGYGSVGVATCIRAPLWFNALALCFWMVCTLPAWAQNPVTASGGIASAESALSAAVPASRPSPSLKELLVERTTDGVALSVQLDLDLPAGVVDVLLKSVPLYFVMQADVFRERWYWSDQRISRRARTYRLAYQPLTRQWRLSMATGAGPGASLEYALHQNHASLSSALAAMARQNHWLVAETPQLPAEGALWVDFRFSLDPALLPRPFQFGVTSGDWGLDLRRRSVVPQTVTPVVSAADAG